MTKKERIAALEKQVADLTKRVGQQDITIALLRGQNPLLQPLPAQPWPPAPYSYDPNTCVSTMRAS